MPKSIVHILDEMELGRQRYTLADTLIKLIESIRTDCMPSVKTWEAFSFLLILRRMIDDHLAEHTSSVSALSRTLGIPRATLIRRLKRLQKMGAISKQGSRYRVIPEYMNSPQMIEGFKIRREMVRRLPPKLKS
jgi:hypothetical protein